MNELTQGLSAAISASGEWNIDAESNHASGGMWTSGLYYEFLDHWNIGAIFGVP